MKTLFFLIVFFFVLALPLSSAAKVTGSFTVTGEPTVNNESFQETQEEEQNSFLEVIKNFFKKIFSFFKND